MKDEDCKPTTKKSQSKAMPFMVASFIVGLIGVFAWRYWPKDSEAETAKDTNQTSDVTQPTDTYISGLKKLPIENSIETLKSQVFFPSQNYDAEILKQSPEIAIDPKNKELIINLLVGFVAQWKNEAIKEVLRANPALALADLNGESIFGPLPFAISLSGNVELLSYVLKEYPESRNVDSKGLGSPLHAAAYGSSFELANYLVTNHKEFISSVDADGNTPLHILMWSNKNWDKLRPVELIPVMVAHSAHILTKQNNMGETPLDIYKKRSQPGLNDSELANRINTLLSVEPQGKKLSNNDLLLPHSFNRLDDPCEYRAHVLSAPQVPFRSLKKRGSGFCV